jgi:iron complex transport system ATP-binding protein
MLEVTDLHTGYDKTEIVHGISFNIGEGEFVCIVGANGCGKTTTLKTILGLIKPFSGSVKINGKNALTMKEKERAKYFAYIPQAHTPPFPFSVADVVIMGRTPHISELSIISPRDRYIAYEALCTLGIEDLADATYTELSGGQQQLVLIARALAQQPEILIMDEPTASLDFGNQQMVLKRMKVLAQSGTSVIMVTHDPDHALFCATKVIAMQQGRIIGDGLPNDVMTNECLHTIYDTQAKIIDVEVEPGKFMKVCVPLL